LVVLATDGNDYHMNWSQSRWNDQPLIITMRHDEAADQPRRNAPARCPGILQLALAALELHAKSLGKILTQEMAGSPLKRPSILHHRFNAECVDCTGELLALALRSGEYGHRHPVLGKCAVNLQHLMRFFFRLFLRGMGGVAFLPEELGSAQK